MNDYVICCFVWVWNLSWDINTKTQSVFKNRVLRILFGPKCWDVIGDWRKLHNEKLQTYIVLFTKYMMVIK
jgi:hypothetical protein